MKLGGGIVTITSILAVALTATTATAAPVTVGSSLTGSFTLGAGTSAAPLTFANLSLPEPGSIATSPVNGNVIGWQIIGGPGTTGAAYKLRVLRPVGEGKYLGVGTSAPAKPIGAPAPTSLPIQAGDLVAIDIPAESTLGFTTIAGSKYAYWNPAIADGSTAAAVQEEEEKKAWSWATRHWSRPNPRLRCLAPPRVRCQAVPLWPSPVTISAAQRLSSLAQ